MHANIIGEGPLPLDSWNFPVAKLPHPQIRVIFVSWIFLFYSTPKLLNRVEKAFNRKGTKCFNLHIIWSSPYCFLSLGDVWTTCVENSCAWWLFVLAQEGYKVHWEEGQIHYLMYRWLAQIYHLWYNTCLWLLIFCCFWPITLFCLWKPR